MSSVLPFDIIVLLIDIVGENNDTDLLKELALVSHSFLQICNKHLFATVELHDAVPKYHLASSKKGFIKLLKSRPDVINYIRKLRYKVTRNNDDDHLLLPLLSNLLPTISRLNCLAFSASMLDWNTLDSSLTSAVLRLMHLPTINHIDLSYIKNFPLSSLTPSINLHRLDILYLNRSDRPEEDSCPEIVIQLPKIREFHTSGSSLLTTKFLHAKRQDGQPAFNFMDLRRLSTGFSRSEDEQNIRYLLQNAKLLERLHISTDLRRSLVGLLSPSARTLKVLEFTVFLYHHSVRLLTRLYEELEAMAGHNMLEALFFEVQIYSDGTDVIGSLIQKVEEVLAQPGWSALKQVSFKVLVVCGLLKEDCAKLSEALQSLPDKYLSHNSKIESVTFNVINYSAYYVANLY